MPLGPFKESERFSMGVELELQLLSPHDLDLTGGGPDLIELLNRQSELHEVKPEITKSMLEVTTGIHRELGPLVEELWWIRDEVVRAAGRLNLTVSGGGAHPFQHWNERTIQESPRFKKLSQLYGYLVKQFTVFGQHVHIGCSDGDEALFVLHSLSRYVPHFIALAAASPFYQGAETAFDSSRLNSVSAFPLSGRAPCLLSWDEFGEYFERLEQVGIVASMKDFYWDIRPKPEFGTIEVRVCDTPLTVERAAVLAAYIQALARYLIRERPFEPREEDYLVYTYNRFSASRFGLGATYIDPGDRKPYLLARHIQRTLHMVSRDATVLGSSPMVSYLGWLASDQGNDATWMRAKYKEVGSLPALMRSQAERWRNDDRLLRI